LEFNRLVDELYGQLKQQRRLDLRGALASPILAYLVADVPGLDHRAAARLSALNQEIVSSGSCRCAIYAFPVATAPDLNTLRRG
jgi:hypothetical protein